jgi:hypothetical protein
MRAGRLTPHEKRAIRADARQPRTEFPRPDRERGRPSASSDPAPRTCPARVSASASRVVDIASRAAGRCGSRTARGRTGGSRPGGPVAGDREGRGQPAVRRRARRGDRRGPRAGASANARCSAQRSSRPARADRASGDRARFDRVRLLDADPPRRLELLPELGKACRFAGDRAGAEAALREAIDRSSAIGDRLRPLWKSESGLKVGAL